MGWGGFTGWVCVWLCYAMLCSGTGTGTEREGFILLRKVPARECEIVCHITDSVS